MRAARVGGLGIRGPDCAVVVVALERKRTSQRNDPVTSEKRMTS